MRIVDKLIISLWMIYNFINFLFFSFQIKEQNIKSILFLINYLLVRSNSIRDHFQIIEKVREKKEHVLV